jgi:SAM-dependent methyltransferase
MEEAADAIPALYARHGAAWARLRGARETEGPWIARLLALLPPAARVLDLGCGSGRPIAARLAAAGHALTGVDAAPVLLERFRAALPRHRAILADMRRLTLPEHFDAVLAWDSLFHLSRDAQRAMIPRMAAHAAPGGLLLFTSGPADGIALGTLEGETLFHASLSPAEYRARLAAAGCAVLGHRAEDRRAWGRTVWLARRLPSRGRGGIVRATGARTAPAEDRTP